MNPRVLRLSIIVGALFFLGLIGTQVVRLISDERRLSKEVDEVAKKTEMLAKENNAIKTDLQYYADTENLMKEFKSLFNYRAPNEELHIIVPKK